MIYFNKNQAINFRHVTLSDKKASGEDNSRRATVCELVEVLPREGQKPVLNILAKAVASCDSRDNFKKERGRKTALKKVLSDMGYDRNQRTHVWNAYFTR